MTDDDEHRGGSISGDRAAGDPIGPPAEPDPRGSPGSATLIISQKLIPNFGTPPPKCFFLSFFLALVLTIARRSLYKIGTREGVNFGRNACGELLSGFESSKLVSLRGFF